MVNYCSLLGATALDPAPDAAAAVGVPQANPDRACRHSRRPLAGLIRNLRIEATGWFAGRRVIGVIALSRYGNLSDKNEPCGHPVRQVSSLEPEKE
jgi:hypothetical protein